MDVRKKEYYGQEHVDHISELETFFRSAAVKEFNIAGGMRIGPKGEVGQPYVEYWNRSFSNFYLVACLVYLEDIIPDEKVKNDNRLTLWNRKASAVVPNSWLYQRLEGAKCVRNAIVHAGGLISETKGKCPKTIGDLDSKFRVGVDPEKKESSVPGESNSEKRFFEVDEATDRVWVSSTHQVKLLMFEYLSTEGCLKKEGLYQ